MFGGDSSRRKIQKRRAVETNLQRGGKKPSGTQKSGEDESEDNILTAAI